MKDTDTVIDTLKPMLMPVSVQMGLSFLSSSLNCCPTENSQDLQDDSGRVWIGTPNVDVGFLCPTVGAKIELRIVGVLLRMNIDLKMRTS